jgi:hypothetical protein
MVYAIGTIVVIGLLVWFLHAAFTTSRRDSDEQEGIVPCNRAWCGRGTVRSGNDYVCPKHGVVAHALSDEEVEPESPKPTTPPEAEGWDPRR